MTYSEPARRAAGRARWTVLATLVVVGAALFGALDYRSSGASPAPASPPVVAEPTPQHVPAGRHATDGAAGEADGVVPDGVTVFNDEFPAVTKLDPGLLDALRRAAKDAARNDVQFYVNSGWRSAKYQQQLLDEAIAKYGSEEAAARWVATPTTSAHVLGEAVDIGHSDATTWLSKHGAAYGLCQIYRNESWHYELRPAAADHGCPPMYADPTQDPRMRQ